METATLLLFCAALLVCIVFDFSILLALAAGLVLFSVYGLKKGFSLPEIAHMCLNGIKTARNILITFVLIGILTALWRAAGTIPVIICCAAVLVVPSLFLLMAFLLNCLVSVLTGTAFGTAATMGVVCAAMGSAMGIPKVLIGGAVLSGVFFGDRCSPVSTSALLVAELTKTNIFDNIRGMVRTSAVPFLMTCLLYLGLGLMSPHGGAAMDLRAVFGREFSLHWAALLPAALILVLSLKRVNVKIAMTASILSAVPICLFLQRIPAAELLTFALTGFKARDAEVAAMMSGGGISSMVKVGAIVCLSSAYSGIFQETGLLDGLKSSILRLSQAVTVFGATLVTAVISGAIACNQTLAIMLTNQLCRSARGDKRAFAMDLENSVVVTAALIPWSIAGGVPLASVGAPSSSMVFAFFLYLLPLWRLSVEIAGRKRKKPSGS